MVEFREFPKMARLSREMIITEKIDGTNASIHIENIALNNFEDPTIISVIDTLVIRVGSRTRWITPKDDNYGFAKWVLANADELAKLGEGQHFGEWWGQGIQRGYGLKEKRFSLFNVKRWNTEDRPKCCYVVPVIYEGMFNTGYADGSIELLKGRGSYAAPGYMNPEGIVVWHTAANIGFKKTIHKDELPKSLA